MSSLSLNSFDLFLDINQRQVTLAEPPGSGRKRRGVRFSEATDLPRPKLALTLLRYVLRHPLNKGIVLRKNLPKVEEMRELLEVRLNASSINFHHVIFVIVSASVFQVVHSDLTDENIF